MGRRVWALSVFVLFLFATAGTGDAVAGGRDGMLAVQPLSGPGAQLITASGHLVRRICQARSGCGETGPPSFAPDGRSLLIGGSDPVEVDLNGGCVNCTIDNGPVGPAQAISYQPGGDPVELSYNAITPIAADGEFGRERVLSRARQVVVRTEAWAPDGTLAVAGRDRVWIYERDKRRLLGTGSQPAWAPSGRQLAVLRHGWIVIVPLAGGTGRRLVRGSDPAFSPNGRDIAFISPEHRVEIIASAGGHPHPVGSITGRAVAWQTVPAAQRAACPSPPAGSTLSTSGDRTIGSVTGPDDPFSAAADGEVSVFVCSQADGLERVLEILDTDLSEDGSDSEGLNTVAITGNYAVITSYFIDGETTGFAETADEFDVGDAKPIRSVGVCFAYCTVDGLAVTPDGDFGILIASQAYSNDCPSETDPSPDSECQGFTVRAYEAHGAATLDSTTAVGSEPNSGASAVLSDLHADGQTLTWLHGSTPESALLP